MLLISLLWRKKLVKSYLIINSNGYGSGDGYGSGYGDGSGDGSG